MAGDMKPRGRLGKFERPVANLAVAYIRVSSSDQAENGASLDAQREKILAYCTQKELTLATKADGTPAIYVDPGVSGGKALNTRPEGGKMWQVLEDGGARHVIAVKLDRIFRNTEDALANIKAWDRRNISMHLIDMGGVSVDSSSAMGRMMLTMMSAVAELERSITAERTKTVLDHRKAEGRAYTGKTPYGFREVRGKEDGKEVRRMVEDPEEQQALKAVMDMRRKSMSVRQITGWLNETGVPTRGGRNWCSSSVQYLLGRLQADNANAARAG